MRHLFVFFPFSLSFLLEKRLDRGACCPYMVVETRTEVHFAKHYVMLILNFEHWYLMIRSIKNSGVKTEMIFFWSTITYPKIKKSFFFHPRIPLSIQVILFISSDPHGRNWNHAVKLKILSLCFRATKTRTSIPKFKLPNLFLCFAILRSNEFPSIEVSFSADRRFSAERSKNRRLM